MIVREDDSEVFFLTEFIRGFNYEWGYDYELRAEVRTAAAFAST